MNLSPIVLFIYNRVEHTKKTIQALINNELADQSILYIYSDGPKNNNDKEKIINLREYLKTIKGFKQINIIERDSNLGLAKSIINGVTEIINIYKKIIVLEDDLVTSKYFLKYMNEALNLYENDEQVAGIHGYMYPVKGKLPETFFLKEADCWGWGTWKRAWDLFEQDGKKLLQIIEQKKLIKEFNLENSYDFYSMLKSQVEGKNNSWAIRWQASMFIHNKLTLFPAKSLVQNIGIDGSGTHHKKKSNEYDVILSEDPIKVEKIELIENKNVRKKLVSYFKKHNKNLIKKVINKIKNIFFKIKNKLNRIIYFENYPRILGNEIKEVKKVLNTPFWNISYGPNLIHRKFEEEFAEYTGTKYAIIVNCGGVALQMALRVLGINKNDEVIHQVDTCIADPFAIINSFGTPIFADINLTNFMLSKDSLLKNISSNTKVILPVHIWGNPEDMDMIIDIAKNYHLYIIEDCCLALGAEYKNKKVGSFGDIAIFSFGSSKPLQIGEGGVITTNDEGIAKELRSIRSWGDRSEQFNERDHTILAWNGRISEILVAIAREQLKAYPKFLQNIRENVNYFKEKIKKFDFIEIIYNNNEYVKPCYAQVVLKINDKSKYKNSDIMNILKENNISCWYANFEPLTSLSFFKNKSIWQKWIINSNLDRIESNYNQNFTNSNIVYNKLGLGLNRNNFYKKNNIDRIINIFNKFRNSS